MSTFNCPICSAQMKYNVKNEGTKNAPDIRGTGTFECTNSVCGHKEKLWTPWKPGIKEEKR